MINRKYLYRGCKWFVGFILIIILLAVGFVGWLRASPEAFQSFARLAIASLQSEESAYALEVDEVLWGIDEGNVPFTLAFKGIRLQSAEYDSQLYIPTGSAELSLSALLRGRVALSSLTLVQPALHAERLKDGSWQLFSPTGELFYQHIPSMAASQSLPISVSQIAIRQGTLSLADRETNIRLTVDEMDLLINSDAPRQLLEVEYGFNLMLGNHIAPLSGEAAIHLADLAKSELALKLQEFEPHWLCNTILLCDNLPMLSTPLTGQLIARGLGGFPFNELRFSLDGSAGELNATPHLPELLPVNALALQGRLSNGFKQIELANFAIDFDGTQIELHGDISKEANGWRVTAEGTAEKMPVEDLKKYWPPALAPQSRLWATQNIRVGMAEKATLSVRLLPEDFETEYFPDDFLRASIQVRGAEVEYAPRLPVAKEVDGEVLFTGTTMRTNIAQAKLLQNTTIADSTLEMTDLNAPGTPVRTQLSVDASLRDADRFLDQLPLDALKALGMDASRAKGRLQANVALGFDAFSDDASDRIAWDKVDYELDATLKDAGQIRLYQSLMLETLSGSIALSPEQSTIDLTARKDAHRYQLSLKRNGAKAPSQLAVKGVLTPTLMSQFAPELGPYLSGDVAVEAEMALAGGAVRDVNATMDLTPATLSVKDIDYLKARGQPASLTLRSAHLSKQPVSWHYRSAALNANGTLMLNEAQEIDVLDITRFKMKDQDFSLKYRDLQDGYRLHLSGEQIDLSRLYTGSEAKTTISNLPSVRLEMDVKRLVFDSGQIMRDVKGHVHCHSMRCESADLRANLPREGQAVLYIYREGGQRYFRMQSTRVGELLRMLDIHDQLFDGRVDVSGRYDDSKPGNPLSGRVIVEEFTVKDAPIMGRVLNLSSLPGLVDSLSGTGIRFAKFSSNFRFADDLLSVNKGKATGPSLGILMDGDINLKTNMVDIDGNLAPAYAINSLLGKVPLIGEALVGGEGESIFAINYGIKGDMDDPSITVNPLSALTPGFTRRFFDIFDSPPDTSDPAAPLPAAPENAPTPAAPGDSTGLKPPPEWKGVGPNTRVIEVIGKELPPPE